LSRLVLLNATCDVTAARALIGPHLVEQKRNRFTSPNQHILLRPESRSDVMHNT
jgi:hypothetical protein